ncbi:glucose dehydrogenase [FAD, quinone]-like [Tribolium madens]|uniref:glucose dehydrogenase [FAD, quinone]-like n=1 Tax=Tribolium madens TaxID=41895 RepID=UPI001CF76779|nr:glucose dehydrogenase [FAD, quinone]-like [Tribolium madens]
MVKTIFGFFILFLLKVVNGDPKIDYYKNLINIYKETSESYKLRQNNSEFKQGFYSSEIKDFGNFDFIIVGAGAAGSVLATRLSEISEWSILVLEAGGEETDFSKIPNLLKYVQMSEVNWGYLSVPQRNACLAMVNQQCMAIRGKSIGGSTALNGLMYVRGNPEDYNKWAQLGNPGWSYNDVLPYFIKSENSQIDGDPSFHGKGGLWNVEYAYPHSEILPIFFEACEELQIPLLDFNGYKQMGVTKTQINNLNGRRHSCGEAFLDYSRHRTNVQVVTNALATQIIIDKKAAQGVIFVKDDQKFQANANLEVIVSAGAFNTPQLLMLSGIGPKDHLREMGIEIIEDLPVGQNLLEHPMFPGMIYQSNYTLGDMSMDEQIKQYLKGLGPLTNPGNVDAIGFTNEQDGIPTVEYMFIPPNSTSNNMMQILNYDHQLMTSYFDQIDPKSVFRFHLILLHEKSRGQIKLKSNNPIDFPDIDYNLFDEDKDIDNIIDGINFIRNLTQTKAFRKLNATLIDKYPFCTDLDKYSRQYWECLIRYMSQTMYHPCGTTTMGPDRKTAVVDSQLKVHGVEKLRVVDAGVIPLTVSGHTAAVTVMIAEKISDVIKAFYTQSSYKKSLFYSYL